jgi:hypothetical protein
MNTLDLINPAALLAQTAQPQSFQPQSFQSQSMQPSPNGKHEYTRLRDITHPIDLACFLEKMAAEPDWGLSSHMTARAHSEANHLRSSNAEEQPSSVATRGPHGEVKLLDPNMADLEVEVENYLDYCSVRRKEALLRGLPVEQLRLSRTAWESVRLKSLFEIY